MNFRIAKEKINKLVKKLDESYKPTDEKPIVKIAELTLILPALGLFYLWELFNHYRIAYFPIYFDLNDALAVLYGKLMPIIYIGIILSLTMIFLIPDIAGRKSRNNAVDDSDIRIRADREVKGLSILAVVIILIVTLIGFFVLLQAYQFKKVPTFIFLVLAALSSYLYLFIHKNLGFGIMVLMGFLYICSPSREKTLKIMHYQNQNLISFLRTIQICRYFLKRIAADTLYTKRPAIIL